MRPALFVVAVVAGLGLSSAYAQDMGPAKVGQTSLGPVLTDTNGMTLYTFTRDMPGFSNCNGPCAVSWPPLMASPDAKPNGNWSVITRDDGKKQWAYKGKALYLWAKDAHPGDTTGEGNSKEKWHVAKP